MKKNINQLDLYIKASRKGSREAELENNGAFKSTHKIHKNFKKYSRKNSVNQFLMEEE